MCRVSWSGEVSGVHECEANKDITFGVFIILTLGVVLSRFYLNVQNEHWDEKRKAVEKAYEKSMMTKAQR